MENSSVFVFQTDHPKVKTIFENSDNYLVEFNEKGDRDQCVIYFSSNNIYYPNNLEVFESELIKKNKFEWYGTRIVTAHKHIFIRDVKKQWYLNGINSKINSPNKILELLKKETEGYKNVITLGSSAGGYAAVLFGQQLNANLMYCFNGQFELNTLLERSDETVDPLVFRYRENSELRSFYDIKNHVKKPSKVLYFTSARSSWDIDQQEHMKEVQMQVFKFYTSHHGIPFIKSILPKLLNTPVSHLINFKRNSMNPLLFSIRVGGLKTTYLGIKQIIMDKLK